MPHSFMSVFFHHSRSIVLLLSLFLFNVRWPVHSWLYRHVVRWVVLLFGDAQVHVNKCRWRESSVIKYDMVTWLYTAVQTTMKNHREPMCALDEWYGSAKNNDMYHMENVEKRVRTDGWMVMRLMAVWKMQAFSWWCDDDDEQPRGSFQFRKIEKNIIKTRVELNFQFRVHQLMHARSVWLLCRTIDVEIIAWCPFAVVNAMHLNVLYLGWNKIL